MKKTAFFDYIEPDEAAWSRKAVEKGVFKTCDEYAKAFTYTNTNR